MVRTRRQAQSPPPTVDPGLLKLLTDQQTVLTTIAQTLAAQQPTAHTGATPPVIRSIPIPKVSSPDQLTIPQFRDWKQRWEDYSTSQQLTKQSLATQHGVLRSALDREWTMLWNSCRLQITPTNTVDEVIRVMEGYVRKRRSPLLDRQEFHRRDQMPGESVDRYYANLKTLDDACGHDEELYCSSCHTTCTLQCSNCGSGLSLFPYLQQVRIRDRLICGLLDKDMQRRVLAEQFSSVLTLDKVLSLCTAIENSSVAGASLGNPTRSAPEIQAATSNKKSTYKKQQNFNKSSPPLSTDKQCRSCGLAYHEQRDQCRAKDNICEYCKKKGHFKKVCLKQKWDKANQATPKTDGTQASLTDTSTNSTACNASNLQLLNIPTTIGQQSHSISWLPDTGAEVDALSIHQLEKLGSSAKVNMTNETKDVVAANGASLGPVGSVRASLHLNGRVYNTTLRIYKHVTTPLLSKHGCVALGLINSEWPLSSQQPSTLQTISSGEVKFKTTKPLATQQPSVIREQLIQEFQQTFNDTVLRPMEGPPMKIELIDGATPCKRFKAHTVPFHWRDLVKSQLDTMETKDIIEKVPIGEAVDWCHPMVVVPKKGSSEPRITVDLTGLNKFVRRPAYPVKVPKEVIARIPPGNKYFTTLDARHGYWQVPLDDQSKRLTTFISPWGSYRYRRNVMGLISAGDEHNRRGDEALLGIENVEKIVEDIIIFDKDLPTHIQRVQQVLERCQKHGITLNAKKFHFAQAEVDWCGFRISEHGYTPAPHLVTALAKFPAPTSKTDVRSFCGLVQQFEAFSYKITELMIPIRSLLSSTAAFVWETNQQRGFEAVINELISPRVLTHFKPGLPLRLETDAAQSKGLGYALWQQQEDKVWKLLQVGSRFVTPTEARYSATEVELLAVIWAVKKCRLFLLGQQFDLVVDHRPLISIINSKTLDEIENSRIQRLKEKLSSYRPHTIWRAGAKHTVVDVFSRFPVSDPEKEELVDGVDTDPASLYAIQTDPDDGTKVLSDPLIQSIKDTAASCSAYRRLSELIMKGFPDKQQVDGDLLPYWRVREDLSIYDDLIFLGSRILIPPVLRPEVLRTLHQSHQGQERTLRRARQAVFWPGLHNDVRNTVKTCQQCASFLPSQQKEPLLTDPLPSYPFQQVGVDLFSYAGYEYLVMADRFSGWLSVAKCGTSATTSRVIHLLKQWMVDIGIPEKLISDNGPQFSSLEFRNWAAKWRIHHTTSSPHYPQSNGLAEAGVKTIKHLLAKSTPNGNLASETFQLGLLELRNTPRADGRSPAQLIFGGPTRTLVPLHRSRFTAEWKEKTSELDNRATRLREAAEQRYDQTAKPLNLLSRGEIVLIQDPSTHRWTTLGEVIEAHQRGRSYTLRTESGKILRRNRRFLRRFSPSGATQQETVESPPTLRRSARLQGKHPDVPKVPSQGRACSIRLRVPPHSTLLPLINGQ